MRDMVWLMVLWCSISLVCRGQGRIPDDSSAVVCSALMSRASSRCRFEIKLSLLRGRDGWRGVAKRAFSRCALRLCLVFVFISTSSFAPPHTQPPPRRCLHLTFPFRPRKPCYLVYLSNTPSRHPRTTSITLVLPIVHSRAALKQPL